MLEFQDDRPVAESMRRSTGVADVRVDTLPDGWRHRRDFEKALEISGKPLGGLTERGGNVHSACLCIGSRILRMSFHEKEEWCTMASQLIRARLAVKHFCFWIILIFYFIPFPLCPTLSAGENRADFYELIHQLDSPDPVRSWDAVTALCAGGDRRAVDHLIRELERDMTARRGTAMAIIPCLGHFGDERTVPVLLKALKKSDEDWLGRAAAARALGDIGSADAVESLIHAAWLPETRDTAVSALAAIHDPRAVEVLLSALSREESPEARQAAVEGLVEIGKPAVPQLIHRLQSPRPTCDSARERALAAVILGKIGDMRAAAPLNQALQDACATVRESAEKALQELHLKAAE